MSSHPKTHICSFNLSLNAPWFEKLEFEKNTMYSTLVLVFHLCFKYHPKTLLFLWTFGSHPMTPHIFIFFSHWMPKIMLSPNDPSFFEPVLPPNAPACWRAGLTPVPTSYLTTPPPGLGTVLAMQNMQISWLPDILCTYPIMHQVWKPIYGYF